MKLNPLFILIFLIILMPFSLFNSGCSCTSKKIVKSKSLTKNEKIKTIKFINPLSTYIKEVKSLRRIAKRRNINQMRAIYKSRKDIMSQRGDFIEMHTFLKNGANLFKNKKYDEALEEFVRVMNQYPEDMNLQAIATKDISICYKKKGNMKEFIKYYTKYYELLDEIPEDEDDY